MRCGANATLASGSPLPLASPYFLTTTAAAVCDIATLAAGAVPLKYRKVESQYDVALL